MLLRALDGSRRDLILLGLVCAAAAALTAAIVLRMVLETGGTNSYALVADSFLQGRAWVETCFDRDCVIRDGRTYVIFPPLPGVLVMPLVALLGIHATGFIAIAFVATLSGLALWSRILDRLGLDPALRAWLIVALAFASPLYYVTLRGEGVWFFAQALAFPLVALAISASLSRRLVLAGVALGAAFLCRQMSILYAPLLFLLALDPAEPVLRIDRGRLASACKLALPIVAALGCYFAFNLWRFGAPLDTGYSSLAVPGGVGNPRLDVHGVWSEVYIVFNIAYLLLQGFHAEFAGPDHVKMIGLDSSGTSILAASPWLLFLFFTPVKRVPVACGLLILGFATALLAYHSNGTTQYNTQRYTLDWMPAALVMLALGLKREHLPTLKLLVGWGIVLNCATVAILAITHPG